ncbi:hypothetical protein Tco_0147469, partial [Tanacetum coccineum]
MMNPQRGGNMDRFCDNHQDKGHHTNDCHHLRRQLEASLESSKLKHLIRDARQRGRGKQRGDGPQQANIINMAEVEGYLVRRIYVDGGALVEAMFEYCFKNLSPAIKARRLEKKQVVEEEKKEEVDTKAVNITEE